MFLLRQGHGRGADVSGGAQDLPSGGKCGMVLYVLALLLLPTGASAQFHINMGSDSPIRKLQIAEMAITNLYVDTLSEDKLVEDAIRGMLEKLDPHSAYTTARRQRP